MSILTSATGFAHQSEDASAGQTDISNRRRGHTVQGGIVYIQLHITGPVSDVQWNHFADILELSDSQRQVFRSLYEKYLEDDWENRRIYIQPLLDRTSHVWSLKPAGSNSLEYSDALSDLFQERERQVRLIRQREFQLFDDLIPYLAEEQGQTMERVRNLRSRHWRAGRTLFPGSNIDLSERLFVLEQAGFDCVAVEPERFRVERQEYERLLTDLFKTSSQQLLVNTVKITELKAQAETIRQSQRTQEEMEQLIVPLFNEDRLQHEKALVANRAIHDLNKRYVGIFASLLPIDTGSELREWYQSATYRVVYPNPFSAETILATAESLKTFEDDRLAGIKSIQDDYSLRSRELSRRMEDRYLQWWSQVEATGGFNESAYRVYQTDMHRIQHERQRISTEAIAALESVLTSEEMDQIQRSLDDYNEAVHQFELGRAALETGGRAWPLPFDIS